MPILELAFHVDDVLRAGDMGVSGYIGDGTSRWTAVHRLDSSALTRELMGWHPTHPGLIPDLEQGHYFRQTCPAAA